MIATTTVRRAVTRSAKAMAVAGTRIDIPITTTAVSRVVTGSAKGTVHMKIVTTMTTKAHPVATPPISRAGLMTTMITTQIR
jgi:hypothetical protein